MAPMHSNIIIIIIIIIIIVEFLQSHIRNLIGVGDRSDQQCSVNA